jgi:Transposase DDE domain
VSATGRVGYHKTARKFSVYTLLQYWTLTAFEQWDALETVLAVLLTVDSPKLITRLLQKKLRHFLSSCSKSYIILCFKNGIDGLNVTDDYEIFLRHYRSQDCVSCPLKAACTKATWNREIRVSMQYIKQCVREKLRCEEGYALSLFDE